MTPTRPIVFAAGLALLMGCGGSDAAGPGGGDDDGSDPTSLDLSAISGTWSAWGTISNGEEPYLILELDGTPLRNGPAGTSSLGDEVNGQLVEDCAADLIARTAAPPRYTFDLRHPPQSTCTDGALVLQHDVQAGILHADFTAENDAFTGTHDLTRGSDPGPKP